ncbi:MAG: photosynthetic complex putative assembly protein PuhB, partial [Pseudomonadota bacterium]
MNNNDEISPVRGLPDYPPEGEHILWQGAPHQGAFIERVFHLRLLAAYFAVMVAIFAIMDLAAGVDAATVAGDAAALIPVALVPLVLLWLVGRWMAKTTVYTITNKRVVLDFGLALT